MQFVKPLPSLGLTLTLILEQCHRKSLRMRIPSCWCAWGASELSSASRLFSAQWMFPLFLHGKEQSSVSMWLRKSLCSPAMSWSCPGHWWSLGFGSRRQSSFGAKEFIVLGNCLSCKIQICDDNQKCWATGVFLGGTCSSISAGLPINSYVNTNPKHSALGGSMFLVEYCKPCSNQKITLNAFLIFFFFCHANAAVQQAEVSVFTSQ